MQMQEGSWEREDDDPKGHPVGKQTSLRLGGLRSWQDQGDSIPQGRGRC